IGADRAIVDVPGVCGNRNDLLAAGGIPEHQCLVPSSRDNQGAVGTDPARSDPVAVTRQLCSNSAGGNIPKPDVLVSGRNDEAVVRGDHASSLTAAGLKSKPNLSGFKIPQLDRFVRSG